MSMALYRLLAVGAATASLAACATTQATPNLRGHVLMEMSEAPPEAAEGLMTSGDVIAHHTIIASHAVVLEEPVDGPVRELEAGVALAAVALRQSRTNTNLPADPKQILWCDVRQGQRMGFGYSDCFMDEDGDGRLDKGYIGERRGGLSQFEIFSFREPPTVAGPSIVTAAVRPARADERPLTQIGLQFCNGDNENSPLRFAIVNAIRDGWSNPMGDCPFGVWPDGTPSSTIEINDDLRIDATPDSGGFAYTLEGRFPAGPLSRAFRGRIPQLASADTQSASRASLANMLARMQSPLIATADAQVTPGEVTRDGAFASQPVRHRYTGVLQNRVRARGLLEIGAEPLEVGTLMYGMPLARSGFIVADASDDRFLTWCAPRSRGEGETMDVWAICLPNAGGHRWVRAPRPLYATSLTLSDSTSRADAPSVERQEVDFGVEMVRYMQFREWDDDHADIHVVLQAGPDLYTIQRLEAPREAGGSARINAFGQWVSLTQVDPRNRRLALIELTESPDEEVGADAPIVEAEKDAEAPTPAR